MKVRRDRTDSGLMVDLLDDAGAPIEVVARFLRYLTARGCSPNTVTSYAYDLLHLWRFLSTDGLEWTEMRPANSLELLEFLRAEPTRSRAQRFGLVSVDSSGAPRLAPATVNRVLTGVGTFYEWRSRRTCSLAGIRSSVARIQPSGE